MSIKRGREEDDSDHRPNVITKRAKVDLDLAQIWENLANEDEEVRLDAAQDLRIKYLATTEGGAARKIVKRLFRGLCSGRKAARLGFFIALVGLLKPNSKAPNPLHISVSEFIEILSQESTAESGASGQDERDHHYGCIVGCMAIFDSEALFSETGHLITNWNALCQMACEKAAQKPWIRSEAGHVLYQALSRLSKTDCDQTTLVKLTLECLKQHGFLQSREGIALWTMILTSLPHVKCPLNLWQHGDPFSKKNIKPLARALLDSHANKDHDDGVINNSGWLPTLHFVWPLVLNYLSRDHGKSQVDFRQFWREVVSEGFFGSESTPERKHTGFLVLERTVEIVPPNLLQDCFSKNVMIAALQALRKNDQGYLAQRAGVTFDAIVRICSQNQDKASVVVQGMLLGSDFTDFDATTGTKIMQTLLEGILTKKSLLNTILSWLKHNPNESGDSARGSIRRRNFLMIVARSICAWIPKSCLNELGQADLQCFDQFVSQLVVLKLEVSKQSVDGSSWDDEAVIAIKERTAQVLEAMIKAGLRSQLRLLGILQVLRRQQIAAEATIQETIKKAWKWYDKLQPDTMSQRLSDASHSDTVRGRPQVGLMTILAVLLYQVYDDDIEAIELLEETVDILSDLWVGNETKAADMLVEIVIGIVSKPSKFMRQAGTAVFEAIAPLVSAEGLGSLIDIINTKEGREGQQSLFETGGDGEGSTDEFEAGDPEDEEPDSDVEVVDAESESVSNGSASDNASDSMSSDDEVRRDQEGVDEQGMNELERALAQALGTRKVNGDHEDDDEDEDDDSDSDMSDSDMLELDNKLAEVFKNQLEKNSAQKERAQEQKNAKENVINLKNRALDLIEIYLRTQRMRGDHIFTLLMPLLRLTRTTSSKQIADRGKNILKSYVHRAKGSKIVITNLTVFGTILNELHEEIEATDISNESIAVASQLNIYLCKLALEHGKHDITKEVNEKRSREDSSRKALAEFWQRWDEWLKTAAAKYGVEVGPRESKQVNKTTKTKKHKQG